MIALAFIGWPGRASGKLAGPFSRMDYTVQQAEQVRTEEMQREAGQEVVAADISAPSRTPASPKEELYRDALAVRQQFVIGGWIFGGLVGLVFGVKLDLCWPSRGRARISRSITPSACPVPAALRRARAAAARPRRLTLGPPQRRRERRQGGHRRRGRMTASTVQSLPVRQGLAEARPPRPAMGYGRALPSPAWREASLRPWPSCWHSSRSAPPPTDSSTRKTWPNSGRDWCPARRLTIRTWPTCARSTWRSASDRARSWPWPAGADG